MQNYSRIRLQNCSWCQGWNFLSPFTESLIIQGNAASRNDGGGSYDASAGATTIDKRIEMYICKGIHKVSYI